MLNYNYICIFGNKTSGFLAQHAPERADARLGRLFGAHDEQ